MPSNYAATMQGDGAPTGPSKYLDLMQTEASNDRARFGAAASQAMGVNPDEVAKARKTAEFLGVHPGVVEAAPQDSMRAATLKKLDTDTAAAPVLRQRYTDADFAKLASDDSGVLSGLESVVRRMMNGGTQRLPQTQPSVMSGVEFGNAVRRQIELNPALDADTARALVGQGVTIDNGPLMGPSRGPAPSVRSVLGGIFNVERLRATSAGMSVAAADLLGLDNSGPLKRYERATSRAQAADPAFETSTGQGIYSGAVSTVQNAPGLALSVLTGNPLPGLAVAYGQVGGEAYGKYRARGATAGQAGAGALLDGGIEVATELLPMRFMVDRLGKAGATEFVKGLLAREVPTEQLATLAQDAVDTAIANPDKTWAQYIAERPDAAYQTLLATIVQGGAMGAVNTVAGKLAPERRAADQAERAAAYMAEVARLMEASKLRARDPGTFNAYMQALADDGQVPAELYVDAQQLANTLNQSAISIEQLRAFAPTMAAQLEAASFVPGADVRVPVAELAAAGPEITTPLIDHLRASETAMSRVEAQEYLTAYVIEKSLSVDNLFVFMLIFSRLRIPKEEQHRVLLWGILGAFITRALFITSGTALLASWHWLVYALGVFLIYTGIRAVFLRAENDEGSEGKVIQFIRRHVPLSRKLIGHQFVARDERGRWVATPLLVALLVIELTDIVFAFDSIPTVFSVSLDPFIVYSSNVFAILGLRALYLVMADLLAELKYLQYGLAAILVFAGAKMLTSSFIHIPHMVSLGIILAILAATIIPSVVSQRRNRPRPKGPKTPLIPQLPPLCVYDTVSEADMHSSG